MTEMGFYSGVVPPNSNADADEFERAIADHVANATAGSATDASFRVVRVD